MRGHGHQSWHPDPAFYHAAAGGGPRLDMGPDQVTAPVNLIGPVRRVTGSARASFPERTVTSEPKRGEVIRVATPTHISGTPDFASGAIGTRTTSFDVWSHTLPCLEVYGTEESLQVPGANNFGGVVKVRRVGEAGWSGVPLTHGLAQNSRGVGVLDASGAGAHLVLDSGVDRPAPPPPGLMSAEANAPVTPVTKES